MKLYAVNSDSANYGISRRHSTFGIRGLIYSRWGIILTNQIARFKRARIRRVRMYLFKVITMTSKVKVFSLFSRKNTLKQKKMEKVKHLGIRCLLNEHLIKTECAIKERNHFHRNSCHVGGRLSRINYEISNLDR